MKIIINADDFGLSHDVNLAVVEAFKRGFVTNATIMVNMPGFEEGVALSKENGFFEKIGLHLNFFEGQPLTENIKSLPLFYNGKELNSDNMLRTGGVLKKFLASKQMKVALFKEAEEQIKKYKSAGFTLGHLDSHEHSHTIFSVFISFKKLLKKYGFKSIRKSLNLYLNRSFLIKLYKNLYNEILLSGFKKTKYFTSATEFIEVIESGFKDDNAICEIMVHPVFENGKLANANDVDFEELFKFIDEKSLISYTDI